MKTEWLLGVALLCLVHAGLAADTDNDGIPDHEDPWPNDDTRPVVSELWGVGGELWTSDSRLPFVGFAGYRDGNEPIPDVARIVANVVDFGATGTEGSADDTQAFLDAIAHAETQVSAINRGAILVPAGVYDVNTNLHLNQSGLVLKGEGRDLSEIRFTYTGDAKGIVMGSGGCNWQYNQYQSSFNCKLDAAQIPKMGDFTLHLASPMTQTFKNNLAAQGNRARIAQWINRAGSSTTPQLVDNIYGGPLKPEATGHSTLAQEFNVTVINDSTLEMDRPLRWTPTTEILWNQPVLVSLRDTSATETQEMGIEDLTIRFQSPGFQSHNGIGENGINVNADHSWVRSVRIVNSDHSIWTEQTRAHVTISDIIVEADRSGPYYGPGVPWYYRVYGHVGIGVNGYDHLLRDFVLNNTYIHDVSMRHSMGCVVMSGQGTEMCMDHHRQTIYANVWTDIDLGNPHRMWDSTGDAPEGYQCGAYNTWWNITSSDPSQAHWPDDGNWMQWGTNMWGYFVINLVGTDLTTKPPVGGIPRAPIYNPTNVHLEAVAQNELWPQNIYLAQRDAYVEGRLWAPAISNNVPLADALSTNVLEDASVGITLTGSDADGDSLSFAVETAPSNGTLSGSAPNLTYTPGTNFFGADSFTFAVNDGSATSAAATVSITVHAVNDPPVAYSNSYTVAENSSAAITLTGSDVDGDSLSFAVETAPVHGALSGMGSNLTYTPVTDYVGPDSFTFTVSDGSATSAAATVSINVNAEANVAEVTMTADVANSSSSGYGGSILNTLNDPFAYDPADPTAVLPNQIWNASSGFHGSAAEGADVTLVYTLSGGAITPATGSIFAVDLYGRDMLNDRCQDIDIHLYSGGYGGTLVASALGAAIPETAPFHARIQLSPTSAFDTVVLVAHDTTAASGNAFTLMEIRAAMMIPVDTDTDGDGLTDVQELALGIDPNDSDSVFSITEVVPLPGTGKIGISWPSATGVLYRVWQSGNLTNWIVVRDWAAAQTPPADTLELELSPSNGYFKIEADIL